MRFIHILQLLQLLQLLQIDVFMPRYSNWYQN